ncbi:MAG: hypothetical protein M3R47_03440 [Chloroflexota bacterium]|nr:hypothetical protein [Chloroflexota bacterium]
MPVFENRVSYLFARLTEPYSLKMAFSFLQEFAETCNREQLEKALIDGLILEGPISIWDRYHVGEEFVRVVGPKIKVALVGKRELIDLTMENVVVNRSGRFKVFYEIEPALKWLVVEE